MDDKMEENMNGYVCFYKGKRVEVYATTTHNAQIQAAQMLKAKRSYDVSVTLAEKNGQSVVHTPSF
jgi:hypothetical protein